MAASFRVGFAVAATLALVAGCSTPPPRPAFPDIRFTDRPPITLDVSAVQVKSSFQSTMQPPHVEQMFPVAPEKAAENWAHDRLRSAGNQNATAIFNITDASAIETDLPKTTGITGALTTQPAERYDVSLAVTLQILDDKGFPVRTASVKAARSQSLMEGITPNDRDKLLYELTKELLGDFDKQMETEIRNNFGYYVK